MPVVDIFVKPCFSILKLNDTKSCQTFSDYLPLPIYFDKQTRYDMIDPLDALIKIHKFLNSRF